ncbi:uncharacterized protein LOC117218876 isoform X1 [Megalopta genalis]|uniref:uncharacterized protein LOC117218876 isoform X1 n=2 Tax=Megalopta genalis TaxID=115081 RepID=UPI003FD4E4AF
MAWFGDGLPSLSNLKGQISNFTKEVLSEGIVDEIDERTRALNEANQRCVELQELLKTKDTEISLLRRQNCELQKTVIELNAKQKDSNGSHQDDDDEAFFWDPVSTKNRNSKNQNRQLQEQLAQAAMRIRELETKLETKLETELKRVQVVTNSSLKDDLSDGYQTGEFLRAKQDMVNRIIQMEEKNREAERNTKRAQPDETALTNDLRAVLSKLNSLEKQDLVRSALRALETENQQKRNETGRQEKSVFEEKHSKPDNNFDQNELAGSTTRSGCDAVPSNKETEFQKKIDELQEENQRLFASVEELDQQHEESIQKLLSLKEEIEKKHQRLQNAYEQLYVDYNQAQDKVVQLENTLTGGETTKRVRVETVTRFCQTVRAENTATGETTVRENCRENESTIEELAAKVKEILKNAALEPEPDASIFETVARQYVDAKWKKDMLEKRLTELNRELKDVAETKESLQIECDEMQTHIDTLMLEIQDLKLNLPSIPEASEERVASLESETESLHEQLEQLRAENEALRKESSRGPASAITLAKTKKSTGWRLEDIPECVEETDGSFENLNRRLLAALDENSELKEKIEHLECLGKETRDQLTATLNKCKDFQENAAYVEELKLDLERVERELGESARNRKHLEDSLSVLVEAKQQMERDNEELSRKNDRLEIEISKWREQVALEKQDDDLREQLDSVTCERDHFERDILNTRKELDEALNQIRLKESQIARLSQEYESSTKEKNSLFEQISAIQDESNDKIDLVNTEKSLLEQEQQELAAAVANREMELSEIVKRLRETEEKYVWLENELCSLRRKAGELESENERLRNERDKRKREEESKRMSESAVENDLQATVRRLTEDNESSRILNEDLRARCKQFEEETASLQARINELSNRVDNEGEERERVSMVLKGMAQENEILRNKNESLMAEIAEARRELHGIEVRAESADMAKQTIENLSHLVSEKDEELNILKTSMDLARNSSEVGWDHVAAVTKERDELVSLLTAKHNESLQYYDEIRRLTHLMNEHVAQIQSLTAERDESSSQLVAMKLELERITSQMREIEQRLRNAEASDTGGTCGIVDHTRLLAETAVLNEKCNALEAALIQEQSSHRIMQHQLIESQNKEANAEKELERLRTHLVEIQSTYTEEALIVEEARQELEAKLQQAEEKMKNSSTAYTSANIRANQQVETLQQQMALIVQQRDDIQNKLSSAEDKILSQSASLTNLQIVLEQFQRDKEKDIRAATERLRAKLNESHRRQEELANDIINIREQLTEAKEGVQAASRLSEQLDKKTERIQQLSEEVDRLTNLVTTADQRIEEARQSGEGKVNKSLIKNILLGYLTAPTADKPSVLKVFSTILDFNEAERDRAGLLNTTAQNGWFWRLNSGSHISNKDQEASLTAAFVRFLESESIPKPQLPALPIQTSSLQKPGHSRQHSTSSTQSTLLLSNVNLPTFPDFVPARNTGSILKEVLKDN